MHYLTHNVIYASGINFIVVLLGLIIETIFCMIENGPYLFLMSEQLNYVELLKPLSMFIFFFPFFRSRRSVPIFVSPPFLVALATPGTHRMEEVLTITHYSQHCVHNNQFSISKVHVLQFSMTLLGLRCVYFFYQQVLQPRSKDGVPGGEFRSVRRGHSADRHG